MPWTANSFRDRHNRGLSDEQAAKAARIANKLLDKGLPEGEAIATANKLAGKKKVDEARQSISKDEAQVLANTFEKQVRKFGPRALERWKAKDKRGAREDADAAVRAYGNYKAVQGE